MCTTNDLIYLNGYYKSANVLKIQSLLCTHITSILQTAIYSEHALTTKLNHFVCNTKTQLSVINIYTVHAA